MNVDLQGKCALVTGGGTGIGRALSMGLGRCGASVAVGYSRSRDEAEQVVREITDAGGKATAIRADVRQEPDVADMIDFGVPHSYSEAQKVMYISGGRSVGGLSSEEPYHVIVVDPTTIQLAATREDAIAGVAIELDPSVAQGRKHAMCSSVFICTR